MLSPFTRRRHRKTSPSPDPQQERLVTSPPPHHSPEQPGRRRRKLSDAENGTTPAATGFRTPTSVKKSAPTPPVQLPSFQAGNTCSHVLFGGQFYPGKDKKRKAMRKRTLWYRIFFSSPLRACLSTIVLVYVTLWHVLVPTTQLLLDYGRTLSGAKHGFLHVSLNFPSFKVQKMEAVRLRDERDRIQWSSDRRHDQRMQILQQIAPDWYPPRNDNKNVAEKVDRAALNREAMEDESDDELAHEQRPRPGANRAVPKPRKARHELEHKPLEKITERGSRHHVAPSNNTTGSIGKPKDPAHKPNDVDTKRKVERAPGNKTEAMARKVDSEPLTKNTTSDAGGAPTVERTLQNMDTLPSQSNCPATLAADDIKTTLVIQSSLDRLWILNETCKRWKSPIVVAVHLPYGTDENHRTIALAKSSCPQLTVVPYKATQDEKAWEYPVNRLRNMALDAVQTSHVLVADIDFVPSLDLDELIQSTVVDQQALVAKNTSHLEAMIVPAFERLPPQPCTKDHDCSVHLKTNSSFVPRTLAELRRCVNREDCAVFQLANNWEGHFSTRSESWLKGDWYEPQVNATNTTNMVHTKRRRIRTIKCFDSLRYEPYVVLRWCPASGGEPVAPYYDERFYGYGKNKIQLISHLRFMGYHFSVLPKGFIVHNPHAESAAKETWIDVQKEKLHQEMDALYSQFLEELWSKYRGTTKYLVQQCKRPNKKTTSTKKKR